MIHLRLVVPADLVQQVLSLLGSLQSALNVVHLAGAVLDPVSVTTIPAAANIAVAAAYRDWSECSGALGQLAINLVAIVAAARDARGPARALRPAPARPRRKRG